MTAAVPSYPPFKDRSWRPPSRDFFGGPPPVDMTDPSNVPPVQSEHEFLWGDVPPEVVFTAGGAIAAPKQARRYLTGDPHGWSSDSTEVIRPLLDKLGPGAASMVEREMDRARAFEVIARAAMKYVDFGAGEPYGTEWDALNEAVAENRAAIA